MIDLGVLGAGRRGTVDAHGAVRPTGVAWRLDWWVGAEDRWHVPAVETALRQSLVEDTPVVETRLRVVGGDVVHRAYAVSGPGGAAALAIEVTNETPVPVALALVLDGVEAVDVDGATLTVDGRHRLRLPRPPSQWVPPAAFVPLPHGATVRVAVIEGDEAPDPALLPDAGRVAAGWRSQIGVGASWSLPDPTLAAAADAARGFLLFHQTPDGAATALLSEARREVGVGIDPDDRTSLLAGQGMTGALGDDGGGLAVTGQALVTLGGEPEDDLVGPVAKAGHWIERRRHVRRHRKDALRAGLLPAGPQPGVLGAEGQAYLDDWWSIAGLVRSARLLERAGQVEAAVDARRFARGLAADVDRSVATVTAALGVDAIPAGPGRPLDAGVVGVVVAAALGAVDPAAPAVAATLDLIRDQLTTGAGGVTAGVLSDGWSPWLTALLAKVEIGLGQPRGLDRLRALVAASAPRGAWPELVAGVPAVATALAAHDPKATAAYLLAVRDLLVVERGPRLEVPDTLAILPIVDPAWLGQGVELYDAPTAVGTFGFAVRWHGERPALLWELAPSEPERPVRIVVPGLDPAWSSSDPVGEALLGPVRSPVDEGSFS